MDKARYAAALAVVRLHRGGWANLTAKQVWAGQKLDERQTAFANAIFYTTAERLVTLDALLLPWLKKPVEKLDVEVRAVLECGLAQALYMQVPAHAAVHEAVALTRALKKSSAAGMVNAVLRRASQAGINALQYSTEQQRVERVYSVSAAVANAAMQAFPHTYNNFFEATFKRPPMCLRVNTLKTTQAKLQQALAAQGVVVRPGHTEKSLYVEGMADWVVRHPLFVKGHFHVQGEASQLACHALAAKPGQNVLDLCAAPGGKTATIAQYIGGGNGLTACDIRPNRLPLIEETLNRLGIEGVQVCRQDGAVFNPKLVGCQRVLCDVPCSGLGLLAKKPDLRYADGEGWAQLPQLQLEILKNGARYLAPGGRLVYSTCTIRPQENSEVVRAFLNENPTYRLVESKIDLQGLQIDEYMVTILPQLTGLDGFFVATLERL